MVRAVGSVGYRGFEQTGLLGFCRLLDHLCASAEDIDDKCAWVKLLLDTIQSPEGIRHLSHPYWGMLIELLILESRSLGGVTWSPCIAASLEGDQGWDRLECWVGVVWMVWPPEVGGAAWEEVGHAMLSLFRQRPAAIPKLEEWIGRWSVNHGQAVPEEFQRICEQALQTNTTDCTVRFRRSTVHPILMQVCFSF